MATTWIVAADESRARVLQVTGQNPRQSDAEPRFNAASGGPASDRETQGADELPKDLSGFNARELECYFAKGNGRAP